MSVVLYNSRTLKDITYSKGRANYNSPYLRVCPCLPVGCGCSENSSGGSIEQLQVPARGVIYSWLPPALRSQGIGAIEVQFKESPKGKLLLVVLEVVRARLCNLVFSMTSNKPFIKLRYALGNHFFASINLSFDRH